MKSNTGFQLRHTNKQIMANNKMGQNVILLLTSLVERVLQSSGRPGKTVSMTMVGKPAIMCSLAARPPSAAAAVTACWKSTAPTRVSRAESFSNVLTPGSCSSFDSATAWRSFCCRRSWSLVKGTCSDGCDFGGKQ